MVAQQTMTLADFVVGDAVEWHRIVSNYGHVSVYRATVKKIGKHRITIEVPLTTCTRAISVRPHNLRRPK
jgi:hypothetical protein